MKDQCKQMSQTAHQLTHSHSNCYTSMKEKDVPGFLISLSFCIALIDTNCFPALSRRISPKEQMKYVLCIGCYLSHEINICSVYPGKLNKIKTVPGHCSLIVHDIGSVILDPALQPITPLTIPTHSSEVSTSCHGTSFEV